MKDTFMRSAEILLLVFAFCAGTMAIEPEIEPPPSNGRIVFSDAQKGAVWRFCDKIPFGEISLTFDTEPGIAAAMQIRFRKSDSAQGGYFYAGLAKDKDGRWNVLLGDRRSTANSAPSAAETRSDSVNLKIQTAWRCSRVKVWDSSKNEPSEWTLSSVFTSPVTDLTGNMTELVPSHGKGCFRNISFSNRDDFLTEFNLLPNGDFEEARLSGKPFIHWDAGGTWRESVSPSPLALRGKSSAHFSASDPGCLAFIQTGVPVLPGKLYRVKGMVKINMPDIPEQDSCGFYIKILSGENILFQKWLTGKHGWTMINETFSANTGSDSFLCFRAGIFCLPGKAWMDSFSVNLETVTKAP